jgi:hypothetical protein
MINIRPNSLLNYLPLMQRLCTVKYQSVSFAAVYDKKV